MRILLGLGFCLGMAHLGAAAAAQNLVMVEQPGCIYCARWHAEVGEGYPKTPLGAALGLRSVQLSQIDKEDIALQRPVAFTPTFLLIDEAREVGRIEGYPGAHFFWPLLERMVDKLSNAPDG